MNEFELIARYFTRPTAERQGVGDDCALLDVGDQTLAVTVDLLTESTHFLADVDPVSLGHKALAVNLSDLAAAGAKPRCFLLSLSLPRADEAWLQAFSSGLLQLADREGCALIGGDTTRSALRGGQPGPVTICITAIGEVKRATLRGRAGARPGDDVWVSGQVGDAALALEQLAGRINLDAQSVLACRRRLDWPQPRVALGLALRGVASAAIDVSDGLLADLGHILERSGVGARVQAGEVPRSTVLAQVEPALQLRCALAGGDDYELLFTAPPDRRQAVLAAGAACGITVTRFATVTSQRGVDLLGATPFDATLKGFDHFAS